MEIPKSIACLKMGKLRGMEKFPSVNVSRVPQLSCSLNGTGDARRSSRFTPRRALVIHGLVKPGKIVFLGVFIPVPSCGKVEARQLHVRGITPKPPGREAEPC